MAKNPWELGKSLGMQDFQIENVRQKAEGNIPMQSQLTKRTNCIMRSKITIKDLW